MKLYVPVLLAVVLAAATPDRALGGIQEIHETQDIFTGTKYWTYASDQVAGQPGVVYQSADRGATWDAAEPLSANRVEPPSITGMTDTWEYVHVATDNEGVFRTKDGRNWEKWNEADVGIIYVTKAGFDVIYVITEDGATFAANGNAFNYTFVQIYDFPLTASAVSIKRDTVVGTSDGELHTYGLDGLVNMTDGLDGRPGPLPGAVRDIVQEDDFGFYAVELADGRLALYSGVINPFFPINLRRAEFDGAPIFVDAIAEANKGVGVVTATDPQRLIYSCDQGVTWTEIPLPVLTGINSFKMGGCDEPYDWFEIRLATDSGGFRSIDEGQTWTAYGDVGAGGSLRVVETDVGIRLHSPTVTQGALPNTTSRFVIHITNHGPEAVEDVGVYLDFTAWYPSGVSHSEGSGMRIDGVPCEPHEELFEDRIRDCLIERLEPGQTAELVWIRSLGADAYSMRIDGFIDSDRLNDTNINNDRLFFDVNVRSAADISGAAESGGGSVGLLGLLALLGAVAVRRRPN